MNGYEGESWHDLVEEVEHLVPVRDSHGHEAGSPSLLVEVLELV